MSDDIAVEITFRDEESKDVRALLEEIGATEVKENQQRGFTGIEWIYAAILALSMLVSLVAKVRRLWQCGVLVDARGKKVSVEKNCDLPRGTVLVLKKDGTESKLHEPTDQELEDVLKKLGVGGGSA